MKSRRLKPYFVGAFCLGAAGYAQSLILYAIQAQKLLWTTETEKGAVVGAFENVSVFGGSLFVGHGLIAAWLAIAAWWLGHLFPAKTSSRWFTVLGLELALSLTVAITAGLFMPALLEPAFKTLGISILLYEAVRVLSSMALPGLMIVLFLGLLLRGSVRRSRMAFLWAAVATLPFAAWLWRGWNTLEGSGREVSSVWGGKDENPNLVLIVVDSLRADHIGTYGYARPTTPNLDRLAAKATVFQQVYAPLPRTLPSWASLLTATYPHTHGFRHMFPRPNQRSIDLAVLPRWLADHEYQTMVSADYAGDIFSLVDWGFHYASVPPALDIWRVLEFAPLSRNLLLLSFSTLPFLSEALPTLRYFPANSDPERVARNARSLLRKVEPGKPFFLTTFFSSPHIPYSAPAPEGLQFALPNYRGSHRYALNVRDIAEIDRAYGAFPVDDIRQVVDLYDGAIRSVDRSLEGLIRSVQSKSGDRPTVIVVTADHGERLGEANKGFHHGGKFLRSLSWPDAHVPLIVFDSRIQRHRIDHRLVSSIDVAPTLLKLLNVPSLPEAEGLDLNDLKATRTMIFAEEGLPLSHQSSGLLPPITRLLYAAEDGTLSLRAEYEDAFVTMKERAALTSNNAVIYSPERKIFEMARKQGETELRSGLVRWMQSDPERAFNASGLFVHDGRVK